MDHASTVSHLGPDDSHAGPVKKRRRYWIWALILLLFGLLFFWVLHQHAQSQDAPGGPGGPGGQAGGQGGGGGAGGRRRGGGAGGAVPVTIATATVGNLGVYQDAIGTVTALNTDSITSQATGVIAAVHYSEGQFIHKGDPLIDIDPRPYEATLAQAQGALERDQSMLAEAQMDLTRYQTAWTKNAIPRQTLEDQEKQVSVDQGTVKNDQATVQYDQVQLSYCHITSPINGKVGLRLVDPGNLVTANSTTNVLVVVAQVNPITVIFTLPEDSLPQVLEQFKKSKSLTVEAYDRTQQILLGTGKLTTIDNQIDTTTGTVKLRATFDNSKGMLYPNQFVNTRLLVKTLDKQLLIPSSAIQHNGDVSFVYLIQNNKAVMKTVSAGLSDRGNTAVTGINPGDVVANSSFDKLQDGSPYSAPESPFQQRPPTPPGTAPMSPSRPFILRPVATSLLMAAILLAGIVAFTQLPVSALPQVDYPTIQVLTFFPGASPDVMATTVTAPLERQFGQMQGLSQMTLTSAGGVSVIVLQFSLELGLDVAEEEVQSAINAGQSLMPADLPVPPVYNKTNPADAPILTLAISSDTIPLSQVEDLVDTRLAPRLSQLNGVGLVSISGGQKPAVRIQVNPTQLSSYGLNMEDVRSALVSASVNTAKGNFDGPRNDYQIDSNDQVTQPEGYRDLVIAYTNGSPIFVRDVAKVVNGVENSKQAAWMNQTPAVILNIQRQPGANTITVVNSIRKVLPQLEANLPASIRVTTMTDMTTSIQASVNDVEFELMLTIGLVVMVIFLFLRSLQATIIPSVAVPLSLVGTFGVMYALGYSLDNLSLMALTISTGFVVDDAIVMIENITRYLEEGMTPMEAALTGAGQIGFTIVSLTVSLIAVLIPLLFMGDVVGRLFREFAVTLAATIIISAVVSLTLTPMMCSRILRYTPEENRGRFYHVSERMFESLISFYGRTLRRVLQYKTLTLFVALATLATTIILYISIPKGFFPVQDTGVIQGISQANDSISFDAMSQKQQQLTKLILEDPAVESLSSFIGPDGINTTLNSGRISINLKPVDQRPSASDVIRRLQSTLQQVQGVHLYMQPVQNITVDDRVSRTQYQYTLVDPNTDELNQWTDRFVTELKKVPVLEDVATDQETGAQALQLNIDRVTASRLGIAPTTIDNTLYDAYGQRQINTLYTQLNQYHVILETSPEWQKDPSNLNDLYIQSNASANATGAGATTSFSQSASQSAGSNALTSSVKYTPTAGTLTAPASVLVGTSTAGGPNRTSTTSAANAIPIGAFAQMTPTTEALSINHQGQFPAVTVSFNLANRASLGTAISDIKKVVQNMGFPASLQADFQGTAASFNNSLSNEALLILAALVTVYIVLGVLYESFIHPITILSTLPSAGVGALLSLILFHQDLNAVGIIGIILLIGIVNKNGILIVDFGLELERTQGLSSEEAIYKASMLRFRPIMMTTLAALLGGVPLAVGSGLGSELRRPLGIAMVGGLILSQALTLYTTPVIYIFFDRLAQKLTGRHVSSAPLSEEQQTAERV